MCVFEEISGAVRVMREKVTPIDAGIDTASGGIIVDTCGTGGDGSGTFNVSTTTAFVVAGCGLTVAKHGNRSVSSSCGSADVLEALGVNLELSPEQVSSCIQQTGIGFLFAPALHGAMKYAIGPRREMGIRTVFNILGPLTNPAGANVQVVGVFAEELTEPLAVAFGEGIEVGRADGYAPEVAHPIPAVMVGEEEHDVRLGCHGALLLDGLRTGPVVYPI